jgi:hypothetical protein
MSMRDRSSLRSTNSVRNPVRSSSSLSRVIPVRKIFLAAEQPSRVAKRRSPPG